MSQRRHEGFWDHKAVIPRGRVGMAILAAVLASFSTGIALAQERGQEVSPDQLPRAHADAEVFMRVDATAKEIADVRAFIERSKYIRMFAYLDKSAALREYRRLAQKHRLPPVKTSGELPVSFRVEFRAASVDPKFTHAVENRSGVDSVTSRTTDVRARRSAKCRGRGDLEVFLLVDASSTDEAMVRAVLESNPLVGSVHFVSKTEALRIFRCIFKPEPSIRSGITADALPASFLVTLASGADLTALAAQLKALPGVDSVTPIAQRAR